MRRNKKGKTVPQDLFVFLVLGLLAAVLAAVNLADELLKNQAAAENLRRQVKNYLDEATQAKNEASELKRQLFKAQQGRGQ